MSKFSDSTFILGAHGTLPVPVAVNAAGETLTALGSTSLDESDARDATTTTLLEEILVQMKIQNQYLLKIVGHADEVLESDSEVGNT